MIYRGALCLLITSVAACGSTTTEESNDPQVVVEGVVMSEGMQVTTADVSIEVFTPDCAGPRYTGALELTSDDQGRFRHVWDVFTRSLEIHLCAIAEATSADLMGVDTVHSVAIRARELTPDTARFSIILGN